MTSETYDFVVELIKTHGTPSQKFKGDTDIQFGQLRELCSSKVTGLQVVLKQLKQKNIVAFDSAGVMQDDVVVSLIGQLDAKPQAETVSYDKFASQFKPVTPGYR